MSETRRFSEQIADEVGRWPGVSIDDGEMGELAFKIGRRQLGHVHGDHAAHFSFPKPTWRELHAAGRITEHPVFRGKVGPAARRIASEDDARDVIDLFRLNYERITAKRSA